MNEQAPSKELDVLIRRVNALIPSSVTPATRIEIHPCDWLTLVDAVQSTPEPAPARQPSKFDLAFEIMRQLEAEDMETMQSCQFGYVMRVTKEGHGCGQVEFRPIETAPKDGSTILLRCPKGIVEGCWEQVDGGGHPENGPPIYWWTSPFTEFIDGPYDAPTHWALIPRDALTKESE